VKIEVRNGLEIRLLLQGGMFSNKRFFKRGDNWGLKHSIDNSTQRFKNKEEKSAFSEKRTTRLVENKNSDIKN